MPDPTPNSEPPLPSPSPSSPTSSSTPSSSQQQMVVRGLLIGVIAIALLILLLPIGIMILFWFGLSTEKELRVVSSPSDRYQLHVNYTGAWRYSSHGIVLRVKQGNRTVATYSTSLDNDGANLRDDNAQINWDGDTVAHICLRGHEQAPAGIQLTLGSEAELSGDAEAMFMEHPDSCHLS